MLVSALLGLLAYILTACLLFGDVFTPIAFMTIWSGRLGASLWPLLVLLAVAISSLVYWPPLATRLNRHARAPLFVAGSMILSVLLVGGYADLERQKAIARFSASHVLQHSFLRSLRSAPRDFQFELHAAVLKDCIPYAWSYREMAFYELKPNVARNVLPSAWPEMCAMP